MPLTCPKPKGDGMVVLLNSKRHNKHELPFKFVPNRPRIEDLLQGRLADAQKVMKHNAEKKKEFFRGTRGYTPKKTMRLIGNIPMEVYFHPELGKYFQGGMDAQTRKKERHKFLKKYPQFAVNG